MEGTKLSVQNKLQEFEKARGLAMGNTPARKRIASLCDPDSFVELDGFAAVDGGPSGVVCGFGAVSGNPVYVFSQDSSENGGAVGAVHAAKISKVYDLALKTGAPVVGIYDSNGAHVSEGVAALNAYGEILRRANNLSGVVPQIALVVGTCAGTSALLAGSADFMIMSEKGEFFLTPPTLSGNEPGAGTAGNAAKAGVAQMVCADEDAVCELARKLIGMLPLNNLARCPVGEFAEPSGGAELSALCASIQTASPEDIAAAVVDADSAIELLAEFGKGAYTAIATVDGSACGVIATLPGKLDADSSAKIAKVVSVLDSFQIPVVTFVNTSGFSPSAKAEMCGSVRDMARLAHVYAEATTAKIAVVTGEAYGAAYVAFCSKASGSDYTVAWPSATLSAMEPKAAVAFLYSEEISPEKSRGQMEAEYIANVASPIAVAATGAIDDVIDPATTRKVLSKALEMLAEKRVSRNPKKHSNIPM